MDQAPTPRPGEARQLERIIAALAQAGLALPGNVVTRSMPCGKTVTRWLSAEQAARYDAWFQNARRLRELLTELESLSLRVAERNEGWEPQQLPTGHRSRGNAMSTSKSAHGSTKS